MPTVKEALSAGNLCKLKPKIQTPRMSLFRQLAQSEAGGLRGALHLSIMARLIVSIVQIQPCQGLQVLHFLVTFLLHRDSRKVRRLVHLQQARRFRSTWMVIPRLLRTPKRHGQIIRWRQWSGMISRSVSLLSFYSYFFVSPPDPGLLLLSYI